MDNQTLLNPQLKFFKNISGSEKELSMEIYVESLKGQYGSIHKKSLLFVALIDIDRCFLNGRCRSNHSVHDSNFLKIFETEKKAQDFNENFIESLKRKITVKLYWP